MREKYTKPGTSIYYYLVEWDPAKLSWEDSRAHGNTSYYRLRRAHHQAPIPKGSR